MSIRPFSIAVPERKLEDLRRRLGAVNWPVSLDAGAWDDGTGLAFMQRLIDHWLNRFDWRAQEARLNALPQIMASLDGAEVHAVHQRGRGPAPMPLLLTHGWPGSFVEFERIIPRLADPAAHGGDPGDAFHVVVPSLPGYGFSPAPTGPGLGSHRIADLWAALMSGLGYPRFGTQGGDIGAGVSMWLGRLHPERVAGMHLNFVPGSYRPPLGGAAPPVTPGEQAFLDAASAWAAQEGAYAALHATRPQTLAYALGDSPAGLAAWIVEKFHAWSDCAGDVESVFDLDALLTNVAIHWFGGTLAASLRLYKENRRTPLVFGPSERVRPPLGVALFPRELPMPPRSWLERVFDVRRWTPMARGGHFAAMEQPDSLVEDIRAFFRPMR